MIKFLEGRRMVHMKKKNKKRKWIIIGAVIAIAVAFVLINVGPFLSMSPADTGRINGAGIIAVNNGMCNVYLIETSEGYALIDAGFNSKSLEAALGELDVAPADIKYVFLTHSDGDHTAALPLFPGATIYMSEDEMQLLDGRTNRSGNSGNSLPAGVDQNSIVLLGDGQEVQIGERTIRGLKAPGHTPGSMLFVADGSYVFSGDAFKISGNKMDVHPFTMDAETSKATMQRLYGDIVSTELTLTAHYGYFVSSDLAIA